jgi:hypothetical protein
MWWYGFTRPERPARGVGGAQTTMPSVHQTLAPLHLPPEVYRYVTPDVLHDLPALVRPAGIGIGGVNPDTLIGALTALSVPRCTDDGTQAAREPKTIADTYKQTYRTLLHLYSVAVVEDVAPVWARLANCHESEQHVVLTQELQHVCTSRGLSIKLHTPVITTSLKPMVTGFQFQVHGLDDMTSGCQPFRKRQPL